MNTERLIREALEDSVKNLPCPEPNIDELVTAGRAMRRRRVGVVASMLAAAVLVMVLAGLSFAWVGRTGRALEPVPANPTTSATIGAPPSELQQWIDALPAGAPPATPYWHDGILYVSGEQIPARYAAVDIDVGGDTVLVGGYEREPKVSAPSQWGLVRGDRLEAFTVPAGTGDVGLSVDGRIAYWLVREEAATTRFVTWDTETNTSLASRTVPGTSAELLGIDAAGIAYWQGTTPDDAVNEWDVRADTTHPSNLTWSLGEPPEVFDGFVPWLHTEDAYRSPDGTKRVFTDSAPSDSPTDCCLGRLRVRPVGPDAGDPDDVMTVALPQAFYDQAGFEVGDRNGYWTWWETNESVLLSVDGDLQTYLLRCSANGGACQRVVDFGTLTYQTDAAEVEWADDWGFARAPVSQ